MQPNFIVVFLAALIPILIRIVWFHPKAFGSPGSIKDTGLKSESRWAGDLTNLSLSYLFGLLLAYTLVGLTVHQYGILQVLLDQPGFTDENSAVYSYFLDFMADYGNSYRNFQHGAVHGSFAALTFALPILGYASLSERRGYKYLLNHLGYWTLTLGLMGGLICHFL